VEANNFGIVAASNEPKKGLRPQYDDIDVK